MLTVEALKSVLRYDPETGLFDRMDQSRLNSTGRVGTTDKSGYRAICVKGRIYKAHRLAWLYVYGNWPAKQIDHINGDRNDNRLSNLREVCNAENARNRRRPQGSNPYLGVTKKKWRGEHRWCARIMVDGISKHIGYFSTPELASVAYLAAKVELHGT